MLYLTNSITNEKELFIPKNKHNVTMYVCGPTVYNNAHIGNARPAVVFDLLYRILINIYGKQSITYARNITDIDDKIIKKANEENVSIETISKKYEEIYHNDMNSLNVLLPTIEPHATDHIQAIINQIQKIIDNGHAYVKNGHVLFDVKSFKNNKPLHKYSTDIKSRLNDVSYKENNEDFVLWKPSKENEPYWDSPFGKGRPGWHIECSAMIEHNLKFPIDIHGGGIDLLFPHHENELSQALATQGHCDGSQNYEYVKYWVHNEFLTIDKDKMSKSVGNVLLISDILKEYDGEIIRYALLSTHYRKQLDWNADLLTSSKNRMNYFYDILQKYESVEELQDFERPTDFLNALYDDLNVPKALAELSVIISNLINLDNKALYKSQFKFACSLLGICQKSIKEWFKTENDSTIDKLIEKRNVYRMNKEWSKADEIKKQLLSMNIQLKDSGSTTIWNKL